MVFDITQLWTAANDTLVWMAPYYNDAPNSLSCQRVFNVGYGERVLYTALCFDNGFAQVAIIINDESFAVGTDFVLPAECGSDPSDLTGQKSTYVVDIPCTATCDFSSSPTTAP